jgi:replicative DNA helicase
MARVAYPSAPALAAKLMRQSHEGRTPEERLEASIALADLADGKFPKTQFVSLGSRVKAALMGLDRLQGGDFSEYVSTGVPSLDRRLGGGLQRGRVTLLGAPAGAGKCLGPGTEVLKFDGRVVRVEEVRQGDRLMGPDGTPRTVLSTAFGVGPMCQIIPKRGAPWFCNDVHVLTLVNASDDTVVDVSVRDFLGWKASKRDSYKQFGVGVDFHGALELTVDPYFLGVWFGDGTKETDGGQLCCVAITSMDPEILALCEWMAARYGLRVTTQTSGGTRCPTHKLAGRGAARGRSGNPLLDEMRALLGPTLAVPHHYLTACRPERAAFLAGWIDTDGHMGTNNSYEITQKRHDYAQAVAFLARSLGLRAIIRPRAIPLPNGERRRYWRVTISGDCQFLPMRLPRKRSVARRADWRSSLRTGITVRRVSVGPYYGFTLDGDGRFLLGDFTVTHNTTAVVQFAIAASEAGTAAIVSPEMSPEELVTREVVRRSGHQKWHRAPWAPESLREAASEAHARAASAIAENPPNVVIYDALTQTLDDVFDAVRLQPPPISLVALDYAQQLADDDPKKSRYLAVGEVAMRSIELARELNCAVLVTSQVNTYREKGTNEKTYSIRESANLEQKAATVLYLIVDRDSDGRVEKAEFRSTKVRDGALFRLEVDFDPSIFSIRDKHEEEEPEWSGALHDWTQSKP